MAGSESQLALAGTFTIESLVPALNYLIEKVALDVELVLAPYNQVFQELLSPGLLSSVSKGVNVFLVRIEDFIRSEADISKAQGLVHGIMTEFLEAAKTFGTRAKVPIIYFVFAPSRMPNDALHETLAKATERLDEGLRELPDTTVLHSSFVDPLCRGNRFNPVEDELGHIPYTEEYMSAIALVIVRTAYSLLVQPQKVLVLDCDNTLWRGVVGEDGTFGIDFPRQLLAVQRFAGKVQAQGTLLCLASKNVEQDVLDVFRNRPEMVLKMDQISAHRINWHSKTSNVLSLAEELKVGLDSFVFIDDNPVECGQMRVELPDVVTLQLPSLDRIPSFLENLWLFDRRKITKEDVRRTVMYKENAARRRLEEASKDICQFIESLQIVIDIRPPSESEWNRLSQLTQKTNQFNFTTKRRSEIDLHAMCHDGAQVLAVNVRDRFGDYGLVGLTILVLGEKSLEVDSCILSCRVLGRGVEHALMRRVGKEAEDRGFSSVRILLIPTSKNQPALAFIESVAAQWREEASAGIAYEIPTPDVLQMYHMPGRDRKAILGAGPSGVQVSSDAKKRSVSNRWERYETIALELHSGAALVEAVGSARRRDRLLPGIRIPPRDSTQIKLLKLWEDVLAIEGIGIDDEYSDLGGTSLMAVHLFAAISAEFQITLPLTSILSAPTVRSLSIEIDGGPSRKEKTLVELKAGGDCSLYLVHEGNGEILLYTHVARRFPANFSVFGVQPRVLPNVPLAHDSIESMADYYVNAIVRRNTVGPIFLGGLCAGGVLAFEMARQLQTMGHKIGHVFLLDSASPDALLRAGSASQQRLDRMRVNWANALNRRGAIVGGFTAATSTMRKVVKAIKRKWQIRSERASESRRFDLFHRVLRGETQWPTEVAPLSAIEIYGRIERNYTPKKLEGVPVTLIHASAGDGNDRPLKVLYSEPSLGWHTYVERLEIAHVQGGHASMFQTENAAALADLMIARMKLPSFVVE